MATNNPTVEEKLHNAANELCKEWGSLSANPVIEIHLIKFSKSEVVKDWHEAQKPKADVPTDSEITHYWKRKNCFGNYLEGLEHGSQWMRDKLLPNLNSENDAAEIQNMHELIEILCADFSVGLNKKGREEHLLPKLKKYTEYKQSKNK